MTDRKSQDVQVVGVERRRRWTAAEKLTMVRETYEPGQSVSLVARRHGVNANQLFHWRRLERDGALAAVGAGDAVVPAGELEAARRQIRELQRLLGKKTMEAEILREAVDFAQAKSGLRARHCCQGTAVENGVRRSRRSAQPRVRAGAQAR